ncbi:MAG: DUF1080 domain-containing protein [Planctomycetes bacterium]|nr:DUF1080 domain-containing protein [Planctomycetota bacterium]
MKRWHLLATRIFCSAWCAAALLAVLTSARAGEKSEGGARWPLVYADDFESGSIEDWEPTDPKAWRIGNDIGNHFYSLFQASQYKPPVRSPQNRSLLKSVVVGSFRMDVRLQSTGRDYPHRDLCLFFGYQDPTHFYYVHLGKKTDDHCNQVFIVDGAPRKKISLTTTEGTPWGKGWHYARIVRDVKTGTIQVFFDEMDEPAMTAKDTTFTWGQVGVGSFDDTGNFDEIHLYGEKLKRGENNIPPEGFVALFNGRDLTGWKGLVGNPKTRAKMSEEELAKAQKKADEDMRKHWRVENGVLIFDGKGHSLCTVKDYKDFELYVDWKIEPKGDSGIYLRGSPQVQIWDAQARGIGSGGLFNNKKNPSKPLVMADNPPGEWNRFFIRMVGEKVTVYLNGKLVVDNVTLENYWERDKPIYRTGQIELQSHNTPLYFRNIFIRELPSQ